MYNGTKVLDVHGHVSSAIGRGGFLANLLASNTARRSPLSGGPRDGVTEEQHHDAAARHVSYMDDRQIDVQVLGPRPFTMLGFMADHLLPSWTSYVNDTIAQQVRFYPDRFVGACQLPQNSDAPDLAHCLPELERCVNELEFVATYVGPDPKGLRTTPGMHEPYWYPLYERCQELGLPIIVHGTNHQDRRLSIVPANYQLGFLTEQYLATQLLSHGDVFDRFPELKVVVCHSGGALNRFIKSDNHLSQRDLSENLFFDTCSYDLDFLEAAIKQRGVPQTLFGSEAPGSGGAIRPETGRSCDYLVEEIEKFDFLSEDDRLDIFNHNPAKVFPALTKL